MNNNRFQSLPISKTEGFIISYNNGRVNWKDPNIIIGSYVYIKDNSIYIGGKSIKPIEYPTREEEGSLLTYYNTGLKWNKINLSSYITYTYLNDYTYIFDDTIYIGEKSITPITRPDEAEEGSFLTYHSTGLKWEKTYSEELADKSYVIQKVDELKNAILGDDLEETFNTLKAVQDWADEHGTDYSNLLIEVNNKANKTYVDDNYLSLENAEITYAKKNDLDSYVSYSYLNNYACIDRNNNIVYIGQNFLNPIIVPSEVEVDSLLTYTSAGLNWEKLDLSDYAEKSYVTTAVAYLKTEILGDDLEETFNTLKAVQDWADEHGTDYATLLGVVNDLKIKLETLKEEHDILVEFYNNFPKDDDRVYGIKNLTPELIADEGESVFTINS